MSIYTPRYFAESRVEVIRDFIRRYNFATLVTVNNESPVVTYLPFIFDGSKGEQGVLLAHMAKANPQWRGFEGGREVTVLFHGPHAYVSPRWYTFQEDNVPTWNYAAVQVHGIPSFVSDESSSFKILQELVRMHDPDWELTLSDKDRGAMLHEIVVFEIAITKIDAKFKLNQNRSVVDQESVSLHLSQSKFESDRETARLMKNRFLGQDVKLY
jgi:transcriptional regulator